MASIRQRGENSFQITVSNGYDVNGKKLIKTKTVTLDPKLTSKQAKGELEKLALQFETQVERGTVLDGSKMTFAEFVDRWLKDYAEKQLQPKTLHRYKSLLKRIVPVLGHIKLDKLQPTQLMQFYNNLAENGIREDMKYIARPELKEMIESLGIEIKELALLAGITERTLNSVLSGKTTTAASEVIKALNIKYNALNLKRDNIFTPASETIPLSSRTILHHHRLICTILTAAVQWQVLISNPAERVKPPRVEREEAAHYDEDITESMLCLLENEPIKYRAMVSLTVYAGIRRGELCGLEWSDVDFDNKSLQIRQASQYIPGEGIFTKKPKNETSIRIISLPKVAIDILSSYKVWQNEQKLGCGELWDKQWDDHKRLFTQWDGKPIFPDTISKWFGKFRAKNQLPDLHFHGLRHTNASILIAQGVDISTVSKRLGHARTSTTSDIYAHALRRPDKEAAEKLDNLFNKKIKIEIPKQA